MSFLAVLLTVGASAIVGSVAQPGPAGADGASGSPVTVSKTVTRINRNADGTDSSSAAFSGTVSATVSQTQGLSGRQLIDVSWSGAKPTGGIWADPNSQDAPKEEYPFVLLQCRGTAATVTPQTCWTQTPKERFQSSFSDAYPPWRLDRDASAADQAALAQVPSPVPANCSGLVVGVASEHWLPFVAADGTVYDAGDGCGPIPPEASTVNNDAAGALPGNTTYAATGLDGTGSTKFDVWTDQQNASLGCSSTVACTLVMIPIVGISCDLSGSALAGAAPADAAAAAAQCETSGDLKAGSIASAGSRILTDNFAVTGYSWWSASNWANRLSVPLSFLPDSSLCSVTGGAGQPTLTVFGSELLVEATTQWAPHFCLDSKLFNFQHVQTPEPEARAILDSGGIEAAFGSQPDTPPSGAVVQAPVAVTGFAISYTIDDAQGHVYDSLKLNARLLAKLITESYPADQIVTSDSQFGSDQGGSDIANNPSNITLDPEFIALNPGLSSTVNTEAASELIGLSISSDVTTALTSYINDDPEARNWLNGEPDPWGMRVNAYYRNLVLPVDTLPLLDPHIPSVFAGNPGLNPCLTDSPVPYLPLIEAPMSTLYQIAQSIQFAVPNSTTTCNIFGQVGTGAEDLVSAGKQSVGHRFMIGITSLSGAARYGLDTAALQTSATASAQTGQFTNASGRTFVAPTTASLKSAADLLTQDSAGVWPIPYSTIRTGSSSSGVAYASTAYPGTIVVYADIPAQGLPAQHALDYATMLKFIAGPGQTQELVRATYRPATCP